VRRGGKARIIHGEAVREEDGAVYRYKPVVIDCKRRIWKYFAGTSVMAGLS
jgi:hypothetical protein